MITIRVSFDDPTYEALEEVAGRFLTSPATFLVSLVRKELGLPYPYEASPLKDHPGIMKLPTTEQEKDRKKDQRKARNAQTLSGDIPRNIPDLSEDIPSEIPATVTRGKPSPAHRRNGAPRPTEGDPHD
jgi:hypothetical protein